MVEAEQKRGHVTWFLQSSVAYWMRVRGVRTPHWRGKKFCWYFNHTECVKIQYFQPHPLDAPRPPPCWNPGYATVSHQRYLIPSWLVRRSFWPHGWLLSNWLVCLFLSEQVVYPAPVQYTGYAQYPPGYAPQNPGAGYPQPNLSTG